jgi:hypothetical protein
MSTRLLSYAGLTLLFLAVACLPSSAATRVVGKPNTACPHAQYTTITAAVNAADPVTSSRSVQRSTPSSSSSPNHLY